MIRYVHDTDVKRSYALEQTNDIIYCGVSYCAAEDQFSKKIGKTIATNRLEEVKENAVPGNTSIYVSNISFNNDFKVTAFSFSKKEFLKIIGDACMLYTPINSFHEVVGKLLVIISENDIDYNIEKFRGNQLKELLYVIIEYITKEYNSSIKQNAYK